MPELGTWIFGFAGLDAAPDLRGELADYAPGSMNLMPEGSKESRPFKGLTHIGHGGRYMVQLKDSWGSLDDDGVTPGKGSLFATIAEMLVYCGQGQVYIESTPIPGAIASNVLRFLLKWNGSYTDPQSGPYAAGMPEPSAPQIGIMTTDLYGAGVMDGSRSLKYARLRATTGGRSRASAESALLTGLSDKAIWAVVPAAVSGQTHHVFFGPKTLLGGVGLHYRIARANPFTKAEYTEADVERAVTILNISGTDRLIAAAGTFTAGDIGKLVETIGGVTFPAGTTVAEVVSDDEIRLSNNITAGTFGTVNLVAYAGMIRRSVVMNWTDADLVEETAWIYDFPPPTCSHAFQLETRMFVCGYADASTRANNTDLSAPTPDASASSSSPGTALLGSIPNQFESYDPRFPVFIPEKVVDILSDGMESYKFIGGQNGVYAAQFLNVTNAAPLTLTVLIRGEGIASANNWCARERAIYLFTGRGQPVRIIEGGVVDKTFGAKVRRLMRGWVQANVCVFAHPGGGGVVYAHGSEAYFFDETSQRWSTYLALNDQFAGNIISSVSTRSRAIVTMENGVDRSAYYFDEGSGSYVCGVGQYSDSPGPAKTKIVQTIRAAGVVDRTDKTAFIGLHINTLKTHVQDAAITAATNVLMSATARFTNEHLGSYVLVRGAGAGGGFLFARIIGINSPTDVQLGTITPDLGVSVPLNASNSVSAAYALIAFRIFPVRPNRVGTFEVDSSDMLLPGITSYAPSMLLETNGNDTQPLDVMIGGIPNDEEGWATPSATFGLTA